VSRLVEECSDMEYYTFLPVIIEAINANDFSIIKEVLEYARSRFNWDALQNSFLGLIHIVRTVLSLQILIIRVNFHHLTSFF
jgi:hypothetical protein